MKLFRKDLRYYQIFLKMYFDDIDQTLIVITCNAITVFKLAIWYVLEFFTNSPEFQVHCKTIVSATIYLVTG